MLIKHKTIIFVCTLDFIMDESLLLLEIRKGNANAYKEIFLKYYSPLCEYASQFISDADAEELVQNLMLYFWEAREELIIEGSLKSYLFVAVRNRSYNAIRDKLYKEKIHATLYDKEFEIIEDPDYYLYQELAENTQKAIHELPENYRKTFELSRFGNLTNPQIALKLNVSVKTVEYRITQSLKILRIRLKDFLRHYP